MAGIPSYRRKMDSMFGRLRSNSVNDIVPLKSRKTEKTQRLAVNLPKGQKHLLRIDPKTPLGQIYYRICDEKRLDPYKYELRHPTIHDEPLNMARPLEDYGLTEITVVSATSPDSPPPLDYRTEYESQLRPAVSVSSINSAASDVSAMSQRNNEEGYMPGSRPREKKKKGLFSFFSRKKTTGSFAPPPSIGESSVGRPSTHLATSPHAAMPPAQHTQTLPPHHHSPHPPQTNHGATSPQVLQSQSLPRPTSRLAAPSGTNRKKRQAPPPPGPPVAKAADETKHKPQTEPQVNDLSVNVSKEVHSRQSSRSSGFEDAPGSPVESPKTSADVSTKNNTEQSTSSVTNSETIVEKTVSKTVSQSPIGSRSELHDHLSDGGSSAADSAQGSLPRPSKPNRGKKKAPAPPTPGTPQTPVSASQEQVTVAVSASPELTLPKTVEAEPDIVKSDDIPVEYDTAEVDDVVPVEATNQVIVDAVTRQHLPAPVEGITVADSSSDHVNGVGEIPTQTITAHTASITQTDQSTSYKSRPCLFIAPPPPDTPPPPESPTAMQPQRRMSDKGVEVSDLPYSDISDSESGSVTESRISRSESMCSAVSVASHSAMDNTDQEPEYSEVVATHGSPDSDDDTTTKEMANFVEQMKELTQKAEMASDNNTKMINADPNPNTDSRQININEYEIRNKLHRDTYQEIYDNEPTVGTGSTKSRIVTEPALPDTDDSVILIKKEKRSEIVEKDFSEPVAVSTTHGAYKQNSIPLDSPVDSGHSSADIIEDETTFDMDGVLQHQQVYSADRNNRVNQVQQQNINEHEMAAEPDDAGFSGDEADEQVYIETETVTVHADGSVTKTIVKEIKPPGSPLVEEDPQFKSSPPHSPDVSSLRSAYKTKPEIHRTDYTDVSREACANSEINRGRNIPEMYKGPYNDSQYHYESGYMHVDPNIKPEVKNSASVIRGRGSGENAEPDFEIIETKGSVYKPEDTNIHIYDRSAPNTEEHSTFNNYMKSSPRKQKTHGVYARNKSEPSVKDVQAALAAAESKQKQIIAANTHIQDDDQVVYAGDGSTRPGSIKLKPRVTDINFTPTTEYEKEDMMEEKSISQIALPVKIKSEPKVVVSSSNTGVRMTESMYHDDHKDYSNNEQETLKHSERNINDEYTMEHPGSFTLGFSSDEPNIAQKTIQNQSCQQSVQALQEQYNQLQKQFAKWQDQLQENQALLSQKKIVPPHEVLTPQTLSPTEEKVSVIDTDTYPSKNTETDDMQTLVATETKPVSILKTKTVETYDTHEKPMQQKVQRRQRETGPTSFVIRSSYVPRPMRETQMLLGSHDTDSTVSSHPKDVPVVSKTVNSHETHRVQKTNVETSNRMEPVTPVSKSQPLRAKSEPVSSERLPSQPAESVVLRAKSEAPVSNRVKSYSGSSNVKSLKGNFEVSAAYEQTYSRPVSHYETIQPSPTSQSHYTVSPTLYQSKHSRSAPSVHGSISMPSYRQEPPTPPPTPPEQMTRAKSEPPATKPKPRTPEHLKNDPCFAPKLDPREELMIAIRNAGGKKVLRPTSP